MKRYNSTRNSTESHYVWKYCMNSNHSKYQLCKTTNELEHGNRFLSYCLKQCAKYHWMNNCHEINTQRFLSVLHWRPVMAVAAAATEWKRGWKPSSKERRSDRSCSCIKGSMQHGINARLDTSCNVCKVRIIINDCENQQRGFLIALWKITRKILKRDNSSY